MTDEYFSDFDFDEINWEDFEDWDIDQLIEYLADEYGIDIYYS